MWHPLLSAREPSPGVWELVDGLGRVYARIELRQTKDGPRYKTVFRGVLIGWGSSLRVACERAHRAFIDAHGPSRDANLHPGMHTTAR